jgi:hypothetical protein
MEQIDEGMLNSRDFAIMCVKYMSESDVKDMLRSNDILPEQFEEESADISRGHGSPYDRGSADSYYCRGIDPHWWPEGTYIGTRVEECDMSEAELEEYMKGYNGNEALNNFKDWG